MKRPNILYLHSHDTGRFIQPYGYAIPTPNLQKLAEGGILFRNAFCAAPTCSPSRAALLTGQCAHSSGMLGLAHRGWKLHDYSQHIIHTLRKAGYQSSLCGVQHVAAGPDSVATIGYDHHIATPDSRVQSVAPAAAAWLAHAPQEPFFLSVGFVETHTLPAAETFPDSLFGCGRGDARYVNPAPPLPDTPQTRQDMADFKEAARVLDNGVGQVLDALAKNGLAENTLVISTTDHGIPLPGMKCNLTDWGLGVLLMLRGPNGFMGGKICDAMVSQIDIFPTLCEYLQIEKPAWLQGRSMMPLMMGETAEINDAIFAEVTHHAAYEPQRAVRTQRWKYIRRLNDRTLPVLPNTDDSRSKDVWAQNGWREKEIPREKLYDLVFDPNESCNLAADAAHAGVLQEMRARLDAWMHETDDPMLRGPVAAPPGTVATDPENYAPGKPGREPFDWPWK
jgi:arylsulfatase A-like enzyme